MKPGVLKAPSHSTDQLWGTGRRKKHFIATNDKQNASPVEAFAKS